MLVVLIILRLLNYTKRSCSHFAAQLQHGNLTLIKLLKDAKFDFKLIKLGFYELTHYLIRELKILGSKDVKYNLFNEANADGDHVINIIVQHFNQTLLNF